MDNRASFSGIMGETTRLLSDGVRGWLVFVAVVGGLNALGVLMGWAEPATDVVRAGFNYTYEPGDGLAEGLFGLGSAIVMIIATYYLLAFLLDLRGRLPERETRIWAYVGMSILSVLGLIVGFILLIVPGIILLVRWSAASGFLLGERKGIVDSLGASWNATRGSSWPIFGAALVLIIALGVIGFLVGGAIGAAGSNLVAGAAGEFVNAFASAAFIAFGIAVYLLVAGGASSVGEVFE